MNAFLLLAPWLLTLTTTALLAAIVLPIVNDRPDMHLPEPAPVWVYVTPVPAHIGRPPLERPVYPGRVA